MQRYTEVYPDFPTVLRKLPQETLEYIFWLATTATDNYNYSQFNLRYRTLSAIRRVCQYWDQIACGSGELWTRVAIDTTRYRIPAPHYVKNWLDRSGPDMPLQILLAFPGHQNSGSHRIGHIEAIMKLLDGYRERWEEFWFYSNPQKIGFPYFPTGIYDAPNLTKLTMTGGQLDEDAVKILGPAFVDFSGDLCELELDTITYDWISLWLGKYGMCLDSLESLKIRYEGWMQGILDLFTQCQSSLEYAEIDVEGQWSVSSHYWSFDSGVEMIPMSNLCFLYLNIWDANLDIFQYLETTSLTLLDLSLDWGPKIPKARMDMMPLVGFIDRAPSVFRSCRIRLSFYHPSWPKVFFTNPALALLHAYELSGVTLDENVRDDLDEFAEDAIRDRLMATPAQGGTWTLGWTRYQSMDAEPF